MKTLKLKKALLFCLVTLTCMSVRSQEYWEFGEKYKAYVGTATMPLAVKMHSGTSLRSMRFVQKVGGVSFLAIAKPDNSIKHENVRIQYDDNKPDGYRLNVTIGTKTITPYIPDWQLIPIVKYVHSEYNSCVSLFGEKGDSIFYEVKYHADFNNTLLGIRLLQADIALMDLDEYWKLPTFHSKTILGEGEQISNELSWEDAADNISEAFPYLSSVMSV